MFPYWLDKYYTYINEVCGLYWLKRFFLCLKLICYVAPHMNSGYKIVTCSNPDVSLLIYANGIFCRKAPRLHSCLNRTAWIGRRKWPLKRSNVVSRCGVCRLRKNIPYQAQGRRWDQIPLYLLQRPAGASPQVRRVHEALSADSGNARVTNVCGRHDTRAGRVYVEMLMPWIRKEGLSCSILPDMGS